MDNSSNAVVVSSSMSSIELIVGLAAGALFAIIGIFRFVLIIML